MLLIFDLDDTLIPTSDELTPQRFKAILEESFRRGWLTGDQEKMVQELLQLHQWGESSSQVLTQFFADKEAPLAYAYALENIDKGPLGKLKVTPLQEEFLLLEEWGREHSLALVTRGTESVQREKMKLYAIEEHLFKKVYIVPEEQKKGEYYERLAVDCSKEFAEMLVVGDKIVHDLYDAKKLGCKTVHIRRGRGRNQTHYLDLPDFVIEDLRELRNILYDK